MSSMPDHAKTAPDGKGVESNTHRFPDVSEMDASSFEASPLPFDTNSKAAPQTAPVKPTANSALKPNQGVPAKSSKRTRSNWWQKLNLQTKATLAAITLGTLPVLAVGTFAYIEADREVSQEIKIFEQAQTAAMSSKLSRFMLERYGDIQVLSSLPILKNAKVKAIVPDDEKRRILDNLIRVYGVYDSIVAFDLEGNVIVQSSGALANNAKNAQFFQAAVRTRKPIIAEPEMSSGGESILRFAAPIFDSETGAMIGVIRSQLSGQRIQELVQEFNTDTTSYQVFDGDGHVFATDDPKGVGQKIDAFLPTFKPLIGTNKPAIQITANQMTGKEELVAYAPFEQFEGLPVDGWGVTLGLDTAEAFSAQRKLASSLVLGTVLAAGLIAAIAALIARRATRPVLAASDAVQKLGQGDLETRLIVSGEDELALLGSNINLMASQIQTLLVEQEKATQEQLAAQAQVVAQQMQSAQQQQEAKEFLQNRALELLMEVGPLRQGDLTIRAKVTEDEIGTIADSYNATIGSLRTLVSQLQGAAAQVTGTAKENQTSVQQLSEDALEQTNSIQAALGQLAAMTQSIQAVANRAESAEKAMQVAATTINEGDAAMNRTVNDILGLRETVSEAAKKVQQLGQASQDISKVVKLIGTFAAQTNLLALKASIEAARAGEEGRGFVVLADEVRSLAQQSAKATGEIEQLVSNIQAETKEVVDAMETGTEQVTIGTQRVEETRQRLSQIAESSAEITALVRDIAQAASAQTQTSAKVSNTMTNVADTANNTSQRAEQVQTAFQDLLQVAGELQTTVGRFKLK
jgi:methyl-accepting chemotaxis protein PixJ